MLQFLLLCSGDGLGHFGLPLLQDAIQVIKLLTQVLFLLSAALLLVGLTKVTIDCEENHLDILGDKSIYLWKIWTFLSPSAVSVGINTVVTF